MLDRILDTAAHLLSDNRLFFSGASLLVTILFMASTFVNFITKRKID